MLSAHKEEVQRYKLDYYGRRDMARDEPNKYMSIIMDGADQSAYDLPHFCTSTKDDRGFGLAVRMVGIKELSRRDAVQFYLLTEESETGANHIVESMHRYINKVSDCRTLPPTSFVQLDNGTRQNKNRIFFAYCESLVAWVVFKEIRV